MLADDVDGNDDGLADQRSATSANQRSELRVGDVVGLEDVPYILVGQNVEGPGNDGEDVDPEALVETFDPFVFDDFLEGVVGALVDLVTFLNLQASFDESERVQGRSDREGAGDTQREKLLLVEHFPFNGADVRQRLHIPGNRGHIDRAINSPRVLALITITRPQ